MQKTVALCALTIGYLSQQSPNPRTVRATQEILKYRRTVLHDTTTLDVCDVDELFQSSGAVADLGGERVRPVSTGECAAKASTRTFKSGFRLRQITFNGDTAIAYTGMFFPARIEYARYLVYPMSNNPAVIYYRIEFTEER